MKSSESGQSLVEMALVVPVLLILLVGIFDFGRLLYAYSYLHFTTQETVRLGGLGNTDDEMILFAKNHFRAGEASNMTVEISPNTVDRKSGDYVTVKLSYPVDMNVPFLDTIIPSGYVLSANSTIRVE
ncbi:TadE/TadG family type IV pilus assembly protein [Litchfieldia alkalitelluris]|uniref:TadE/TadG family type IV pilus assembly protein n=1 Tax=Litchfieldia alkalitelluris TaxID=304268 RepID=UPI0011175F9C|nr:TadE/TadG family type IV pilus assembly protein [Litchfieldia alkalitelluris]